jgi:hypothetical protein
MKTQRPLLESFMVWSRLPRAPAVAWTADRLSIHAMATDKVSRQIRSIRWRSGSAGRLSVQWLCSNPQSG